MFRDAVQPQRSIRRKNFSPRRSRRSRRIPIQISDFKLRALRGLHGDSCFFLFGCVFAGLSEVEPITARKTPSDCYKESSVLLIAGSPPRQPVAATTREIRVAWTG